MTPQKEDDSVFKFIAALQGFLHALPLKSAILFEIDDLNPNLAGLFCPSFKPRPHPKPEEPRQMSSHQPQRIKW